MYVELPTYYTLTFRRTQRTHVLIWISADPDGVLCDAAGFVPAFPTLAAAYRFAEEQHLAVRDSENDITYYDFDALDQWLAAPQADTVNCPLFLSLWNLCHDVAASVGVPFDRDPTLSNPVYDKLFWGNNIPAVTPENEWYTPVWTHAEVDMLARFLIEGRSIVEHYVRSVP